MLQDDELPEALSVSTNLIVGADFRLEPATDDEGEPASESEKISEEFEELFQKIHPAVEMAKMFDWYEMVGIALGTYDYTRVDGKWMPKFRALNPENLEFRDEEIDPQTGLHGVFKFLERSGEWVTVSPGDAKWVLWSEGRESWISCAVRALADPWYGKQQAFRDEMRYSERHGLPIVTVKVPAFSDATTSASVIADVKALGTDTTMTLPAHMMPESGHEVGFEMDLVEATDQSWEVFDSILNRADRKFKMYFLGTNTSEMEGTAGSRATSETGRAISMQKAQERFNKVRSFISEQMVKPLLPILGIAFEPDMVPKPVYLIEGDEDLRERAETTEIFFKALAQSRKSGYVIKNIEKEGLQYGFDLEERKEEPDPMQAQPGQPGVQQKPQSNSNGQEKKKDAQLSALDIPGPDGFENGANYIEGLTQSLAAQAEALEAIDAETMLDMVDKAKSPEELEEMLTAHANSNDPYQLGQLLEKGALLAGLAGRFAVQEDL